MHLCPLSSPKKLTASLYHKRIHHHHHHRRRRWLLPYRDCWYLRCCRFCVHYYRRIFVLSAPMPVYNELAADPKTVTQLHSYSKLLCYSQSSSSFVVIEEWSHHRQKGQILYFIFQILYARRALEPIMTNLRTSRYRRGSMPLREMLRRLSNVT